MKTIYNLKLHENIKIKDNIIIMRVPNGWLYMLPEKQPEFVEFNSEFQYEKLRMNLNCDIVIQAVKDYFNLKDNFITSHARFGDIPLAKKIIIDILMNFSNKNSLQIIELLEYNNVSSVAHAKRTLNNFLSTDKIIKMQYEEILKSLQLN